LRFFRDRANAEDGGKVVALSMFLQSPLEAQYGRILEKHHGKAAHQDIVQAMLNLCNLAGISDLPEAFSHCILQGGEAQMLFYVHYPFPLEWEVFYNLLNYIQYPKGEI